MLVRISIYARWLCNRSQLFVVRALLRCFREKWVYLSDVQGERKSMSLTRWEGELHPRQNVFMAFGFLVSCLYRNVSLLRHNGVLLVYFHDPIKN